jgi:exodeoxyribonuclease VIII
MRDVMLDLEVLGGSPSAAINAIGAVEFNSQTNVVGDTFYIDVDLASSVAAGGVMDPAPTDDMSSGMGREGLPIVKAFEKFSEWMAARSDRNELRVWGNGASFDNVILMSAYQRLGMPVPWPNSGDRCYRTVMAIRPDVVLERTGTLQNALDEAEYQARHLLKLTSLKRASIRREDMAILFL